MLTTLILYSGKHCHLCDLALELLKQVAPEQMESLRKIDVATDHDLYHLYGARIPVLKREDNQKELGWPFDDLQLKEFLS